MNKTLPLGIFQKNKNKRNFIDNSLIFYLIGSEMLKRRKTFSFSFSRLFFFSRLISYEQHIILSMQTSKHPRWRENRKIIAAAVEFPPTFFSSCKILHSCYYHPLIFSWLLPSNQFLTKCINALKSIMYSFIELFNNLLIKKTFYFLLILKS
jgi:hypothetical protein